MSFNRPSDHSLKDSLYRSDDANGSPLDGNISPRSIIEATSSEFAILSPPSDSQSQLPSLSPTSDRQRIPSASKMPPGTSVQLSEYEDPWYEMYQKCVESHNRERQIWHEERTQLVQERQNLRNEIARLKALPVRHGSISTARDRENSDKVFYDAATVKNANEKLRQLSVVSTSGESTAKVSREGSMSGEAPPIPKNSFTSEMDRLASIEEDHTVLDGIRLRVKGPSGQDLHDIDEDPPSPPTSAKAAISSPLPPNYTMHAGHTPMGSIDRLPRVQDSGGQDYWEDQPNQKPPGIPKDVFTPESRDPPEEILKEPHILPSQPGPQGSSMLDELHSKLQDVQEFPKANKPEVLRDDVTESDIQTEEDGGSGIDKDERKDDKDGSEGRSSLDDPIRAAVKGTDENLGGVRLKMKQSMNFGSAFGKLN